MNEIDAGLKKEWNCSRNNGVSYDHVSAGSPRIFWWMCKNGHEYQASKCDRFHGRNCPYCSNHRVLTGYNDLQTKAPEIALEWSPKNDIKPSEVVFGSGKKVWWQCSVCGFEWQSVISSRVHGNGCPKCGKKKSLENGQQTRIQKHGSFADLYPELLAEWNYERNKCTNPSFVTGKSNKKVWWICSKGHEWESTIVNRVNLGRGCPYCSHQRPLVGENDLATEHPELAKEWDEEKNGSLTPHDVTSGSKRIAWWKCEKGHVYYAHIKNRVSAGSGCPYCANKKVLVGYNDLATTRPDFAKQWHPEKNGVLSPEKVTYGSGKKVWWICPQGHEYQCQISNRESGQGCPVCSKRRRTSFPEQAIFYYLKKAFPDAINSYKECFDRKMELDIYIPSKRAGIEFDGKAFHSDMDHVERDSRKYNECKKLGIKLVRVREMTSITQWFLNYDYKVDIPNGKEISYLEYAIKSLLVMFGADFDDVDVKRDRNDILEYLEVLDGKSLESEYPQISNQWHPTKNGNLKPGMFTSGSNTKVWWKCPFCNNEWKTPICERTVRALDTCPKCSMEKAGQKNVETRIRKNGSLADKYPDLLKEWDFAKNGKVNPHKTTCGSSQKVWWKCSVCAHEWEATVSHRTHGRGCPKCKIIKNSEANGIAIEMIDPSTNVVLKEFSSIKNAERETGIYNINRSLKNGTLVRGYLWRYKKK